MHVYPWAYNCFHVAKFIGTAGIELCDDKSGMSFKKPSDGMYLNA